MTKTFDIIRASRAKVLDITKELSLEALNVIPVRMNNNVLWNMGHVIATQQSLSYINSGLPTAVDSSFIDRYKLGTKPNGFIDAAECSQIQQDLITHIDKLEEDYKQGAFVNFKGYVSKTYPGLVIDTIEDAINFIAFHEGLHLGYIMALKRHI
jgi:hypothetical protein